MRKIIAPFFVSLDGVMQGPGGPEEDTSSGFTHGGWLVPLFDESLGASVGETFAGSFDLLLGRKTYDIFAAHWPEVAKHGHDDPGEHDLAVRFDRATKYVATHRPESLGWQNSVSLGHDVVASLRKLKAGDGPDLILQGSSELTQTLLAHDLIDQFRLMIFPVVLGQGKRLFGAGTVPRSFAVARSTTSPKGVLVVSYDRVGAMQTGSFALEQPTEAELKRRADNR
ncbi:MAG: dihydrofolate reductase family protein [Polyangiales bacterium]